MADMWLRRTPAGFIPADPNEIPDSWRIGDLLHATIKKPRNARLHRKAFVLLGIVFPHTEYRDKELLRKAMTIGAGFVEPIVNPLTGEVHCQARSWQFSQMSDEEFHELYNRLIDVAVSIIPKSKRDDWAQAVEEVIRF